MGGTTYPTDWKGDELGDERSVKELPLTAHDQAIVRELWCRAVTYALYGKDGTPKDQRVLEVWNGPCLCRCEAVFAFHGVLLLRARLLLRGKKHEAVT